MRASLGCLFFAVALSQPFALPPRADVPSQHPLETARPTTPAPSARLGRAPPPAPRPALVTPKKRHNGPFG